MNFIKKWNTKKGSSPDKSHYTTSTNEPACASNDTPGGIVDPDTTSKNKPVIKINKKINHQSSCDGFGDYEDKSPKSPGSDMFGRPNKNTHDKFQDYSQRRIENQIFAEDRSFNRRGNKPNAA